MTRPLLPAHSAHPHPTEDSLRLRCQNVIFEDRAGLLIFKRLDLTARKAPFPRGAGDEEEQRGSAARQGSAEPTARAGYIRALHKGGAPGRGQGRDPTPFPGGRRRGAAAAWARPGPAGRPARAAALPACRATARCRLGRNEKAPRKKGGKTIIIIIKKS